MGIFEISYEITTFGGSSNRFLNLAVQGSDLKGCYREREFYQANTSEEAKSLFAKTIPQKIAISPEEKEDIIRNRDHTGWDKDKLGREIRILEITEVIPQN